MTDQENALSVGLAVIRQTAENASVIVVDVAVVVVVKGLAGIAIEYVVAEVQLAVIEQQHAQVGRVGETVAIGVHRTGRSYHTAKVGPGG